MVELTPPLPTDRLVLRMPEPTDAPVLHLLFADPAVMRHVGDGSLPTPESVQSFVDRQISAHAAGGPCLLTVVRAGEILGFTGVQPWTHPWGPPGVLEIGWRLGRIHWGHGYATEAARATLAWMDVRRAHGSGEGRLMAMIHPENQRSRGVAAKLGMSPLAEHVSPRGDLVLEYGPPPA